MSSIGDNGGAASAVTEIEEEPDSFPCFDVVAGMEADHHYHSKRPAGTTAAVQKKIVREWRILENSLPDSICVRACEGRVDLMRAAIVGAAGTPYHDGLFFFDICFPPKYPAVPPLVHYRAFGYRINPNLYVNGYVCLSLLNTWFSQKIERWNPQESTVFQVLLSIQALVLNEIPYMNEPGRTFSEKKSAAYTEEVFLISCKSMMLLLRRPPVGFEAFTRSHFRQRARTILEACKDYTLDRARVGYYHGPPGKAPGASKRFKSSMRELFPSLVSALHKEAPFEDFSKLLEDVAAVPPEAESEVAGEKKKKRGIAGKIFGMLGKLFGLKEKTKSDTSSSSKVIPQTS